MEPVFPLEIDLAQGRGTLAARLRDALRGAIVDGRLAAGTALPSSRAAAAALGVARNTVVAAYDLLVAEGYLLPRRGAKAVVANLATRAARTRSRPTVRIDPTPFMAPDPPRALPARSFRLGIPEHRFF